MTIVMMLVLFLTLGLNLLWLAIPGNNAEVYEERFNQTFRLSTKANHTSTTPSHEDEMEENKQRQISINGRLMEVTNDINIRKMQTNKHLSTDNYGQDVPRMLPSLHETTPSPAVDSEDDSKLLLLENMARDHDSVVVQNMNTTNKAAVQTDRPLYINKHNSVLAADQKTGDFSVTTTEPDTTSGKQSTKSKPPAPWRHWGACSVACGTGAQERSRQCGPNCQEVESRECYLKSCHGIMSGTEFSDINHESQWSPSSGNHSYIKDQSFLDTDIDACTMWSTCKDEYLQRYTSQLTDLPNCPCYLPFNLHRDNNVWDAASRRFYKWVEVNATEEKLSVYKPEAYKCVRSLLFPGASTLASQICCYSFNLKLITRGRNAGTVNLISPQISWELHYKIDILPWVICKGDWTRYNRVLPPNNMLGCHENPNYEKILEEIRDARDH